VVPAAPVGYTRETLDFPEPSPKPAELMPANIPALTFPHRGQYWKWCVCGLLLLATMINYMDRLTLNLLGVRIQEEFHLDDVQYAHLESAFAVAFAVGALVMGVLADTLNVRWLYAASVVVWSLAGFATGYAQGFVTLLVCRFLLGLAEAGHWPCALRTTQHLLTPEERTTGNGILQSGAALGSVLMPLVILAFLWWNDSWRYPFFAVGITGLAWVVFWLLLVRKRDLDMSRTAPEPAANGQPPDRPARQALPVRRFCALLIVVVCINATWHLLRAWLPFFLQKQHHYDARFTNLFFSVYYLAAGLGSLAAGVATLYLGRRFTVHTSRLLIYLACALLTALSLAVSVLPAGPVLLGHLDQFGQLPVEVLAVSVLPAGALLLALLLVVAFGSLGVFPAYYSLSQDLTVRHQGKLSGVLGTSCWLSMVGVHQVVGHVGKQTGDYSLAVALVGLAPLVGLAALVALWGPTPEPAVSAEAAVSPEVNTEEAAPATSPVAIKPA
jgi:ACS family hexuronate transporter-like MFS transporter